MNLTQELIERLANKSTPGELTLAMRLGCSIRSVLRWESGKVEPLPVYRRKMESIKESLDKREAEAKE